MKSSAGTPRILYLHGGSAGPRSRRALILEAACEARGIPFLCPDLDVPGSGPAPSSAATELVLSLLDEHLETYAVASGTGASVLVDSLAEWRGRRPEAPLPVTALALFAPTAGVRVPTEMAALGVPIKVLGGAEGDVLPQHGRRARDLVGSLFSAASDAEFRRRRMPPDLTFGIHGSHDLRHMPQVAAEAADVLTSAYGTLSHPRDVHLRRLVNSSGILAWARDGARLVGCSQVRADGKWGACGTLPAYRGFGIGFRLARLGQRRIPGQFVEVGRDSPHAVQLVLGCGFRPVHEESTVRSVLKSSVGREIELVEVDALGVVYRRQREGGRDTGPLRLCVSGRPDEPA